MNLNWMTYYGKQEFIDINIPLIIKYNGTQNIDITFKNEKKICVEINDGQTIINCNNGNGWFLIFELYLKISDTETIIGIYNIIHYFEISKYIDNDTTKMVLTYL